MTAPSTPTTDAGTIALPGVDALGLLCALAARAASDHAVVTSAPQTVDCSWTTLKSAAAWHVGGTITVYAAEMVR